MTNLFQKPIQLYSTGTPNGDKVHIFLEEAEIPYEAHTINIRVGEQLLPEFIAINPNNRIPVIIDPNNDNIKVFESAAILIYLAERIGKFLPPVSETKKRYEVLEWTMWQMGGVGPMFGQLNHFNSRDEKVPYAITRYHEESKRLLRILNKQLETEASKQTQNEKNSELWVAGGKYSIADICLYPWVRGYYQKRPEELESGAPFTKKWLEQIGKRPAVIRGEALCKIDNLSDPTAFGTFVKK